MQVRQKGCFADVGCGWSAIETICYMETGEQKGFRDKPIF
jgi:hypothetical protein